MFRFLGTVFLKPNRKLPGNYDFLPDFKMRLEFYTVVIAGFFIRQNKKIT